MEYVVYEIVKLGRVERSLFFKEGIRLAPVARQTNKDNLEYSLNVPVIGTAYFCVCSYRNLLSLKPDRWRPLKSDLALFVVARIGHDNDKSFTCATYKKCADDINNFLEEVAKQYGQVHATRFIKTLTGFKLKNNKDFFAQVPFKAEDI